MILGIVLAFVVITIWGVSVYLKKRLARTRLLVKLHQEKVDELEDSGRELIITIRRGSVKLESVTSPARKLKEAIEQNNQEPRSMQLHTCILNSERLGEPEADNE